MSNKKAILLAAICTEGILLAIWLSWYLLTDQPLKFNFSLKTFFYALTFTIPLILINYFIFIKCKSDEITNFLNEAIIPLCKSLDLFSALIISILAGVCEELFFRGLLLTFISDYCGIYFAILTSSILFSVLHFIGRLKKYKTIVLIYTFIGIYFALIVAITDNILIAILTHTIYDFIAINWFKKLKQYS